jgi:TRAP-type C4-dicarboxylate transport system substrate-binding protein
MLDLSRADLEKELAARYNAKLLFLAPWPGTFVITKKEVPNLLDWRGIKIRASATPAQDQIIRCGGDAFYMPGSEIYSGLDKGVIDGVISSIDWFLQFNLQEKVKYLYMLPFGIQFFFGAANLNAFNALPGDVQAIVLDEGKKMERVFIEEANKVNSSGAEAFKKAGVKVVYPSSAELSQWREKAQMPLWKSAYSSWRPETVALFNKITKALNIAYTP